MTDPLLQILLELEAMWLDRVAHLEESGAVLPGNTLYDAREKYLRARFDRIKYERENYAARPGWMKAP